MNAMTSVAKPARKRLGIRTAPVDSHEEVAAPAPAVRLVPSAPRAFPLRLLRRAAENVRHTRVDEDVAALAKDIEAHGLLQSLIGYADGELVHIVGGGRRFQALRVLEDEGVLDGDFSVPVLIRGIEEAIELSLSENLQQRTMSPVDEFFAFRALMENPANTPEILAKRFGFTERVVKQRLRMAALATEILDALAARTITLDVAMAYARTQDQTLQLQIFKTEARRSYDPHRLSNITYALSAKGMKTDDPLFQYLGADAYHAAGGRYEDDLFLEGGADQVLANPALALSLIEQKIEAEWPAYAEALRAHKNLSPSIEGFVLPPGLRLPSWSGDDAKAPPGKVRVSLGYDRTKWAIIRKQDLPVDVLIGIDHKGQLAIFERTAFVDKKHRAIVDPPEHALPPQTPEQRAAADRLHGIVLWQRRLAIGPFAGTPLEGRASWVEHYVNGPRAVVRDGVNGWMVPVEIFVTDEQIAAQAGAAAAHYDQLLAQRAADEERRLAEAAAVEKRSAELYAIDPLPAVALVDGDVWGRNPDDGSYSCAGDADGYCESWQQLLDTLGPENVTATFATREAFDDREAGE